MLKLFQVSNLKIRPLHLDPALRVPSSIKNGFDTIISLPCTYFLFRILSIISLISESDIHKTNASNPTNVKKRERHQNLSKLELDLINERDDQMIG